MMEKQIGNFYKGQWIALNWAARLSAILSFTGSCMIIYMILRRRKVRLALVHNRILMGMSIYDILGGFGYFTASNASPRTLADQVYGAIGNDATCTAQGIFLYLGSGVPLYNMMLSIYYLLVIRYEVREDVVKKYEKFMHLYVFVTVVITITVSLIFNLISTSGGIYCVIVGYPENERDESNIGETLTKFTAASAIFLFVVITLCMMGVFCTVKEQASTMNQYPSIRNSVINNRNQNQLADNNNNNARQYDDTKTQASLYIAAYLFSYVFVTIGMILDDDTTFGLSLMISITLPLQGFWNMLNFVRPKYIAIRQKNLSKPFVWVLKASIFSSLEEEEQKKRLADRRATFRRNFSSTSNPTSPSNHASPAGRTRSSLNVDEENPTTSECNNNIKNTPRRMSCQVIGTQLSIEDNINSDHQQQHQQQRGDDTSSKSLIPRLTSPSMTTLIAYDRVLDRTMFLDDTLPIIKKQDVSKATGKMKRRNTIP